MSMKKWRTQLFTVLMVIVVSSLSAQDNRDRRTGTAESSGSHDADTAFLRKNINDNINEIKMAELAIERDVRQDVKNIAITMRDDHKQILNDLLTYATENNITAVTESTMNISADTTGLANASSGGATVMTKNRREDAQSEDESRNKAEKKKATQIADANDPSDYENKNKRGTGYDHSRHQQATGDSGRVSEAGINQPDADEANSKHMQDISKLQEATGDAFSTMWIDHMKTMHEAKLQELKAAANTIQQAKLRQLVAKAIPKIQRHLKMLQQQ